MPFESSRLFALSVLCIAAAASTVPMDGARANPPWPFQAERSRRCPDPRLYNGAPLGNYPVPVPGTAQRPYYDHGPNWGTDPRASNPVYGIDPACYR